MVRPVTVEFIGASGGDVAFCIDRPFDGQRPRKGRRRRFQPFRNLNTEFVPHAGAGGGVFEKEVDRDELAHLDELVELLVGTRYRPCARIGGEIPG